MNDRGLPARLYVIARRGLRPNSVAAFVFAVICVAGATLIRYAIESIASNAFPFAIYFPAIMIATFVGGRVIGAVTVFLSAAAAFHLFIFPGDVWLSFTSKNLIDITLFLLTAFFVLWFAEQFRCVVKQLDDEQREREIVVEELHHRVKNKLATIYAILRHELRGHPATWESVSGRLRALSAADDYLTRLNGAGMTLHQILKQELAPYDVKRISFTGEAVEIHGKLPVALALVIHELSTNAAKYGSLSSPGGRLDISWRIVGDEIALDWVESGGPLVTPPAKRSFGSNLIERSLNVFGGTAKIAFAMTGVVCRIRFPKTAASPHPKPASTGSGN